MEQEKALPTMDEIYNLVKENNRMLKSMRRSAFIGGVLKFIFWIVILVVIPYFMYTLYIKPIVDQIIPVAQQFQESADSVNATVSGLPDFNALIERFTGGGQ